jgi:hypothetical protein
MSSPIRKAVIRRIAENKRVSLAVAAHIYACKPIKVKQSLCLQEEKRRTVSDTSQLRPQGE